MSAYPPVPDTAPSLPATIGGWTVANACPRHPHARHHWTLTGDPWADGDGFWAALAFVAGDMPYYSIVANVRPGKPWTAHVVVGDMTKPSVRMTVGCAPTCQHEAAT